MRVIHVGLDKATRAFLRERGFALEDTGPINDVEELESWLKSAVFDVVVVNLDAGSFGIYAARHLRHKKLDIPVVGIKQPSTEEPWPEVRATFLEQGGDDLIQGPPNPRELAASLRAVSRRFAGAAASVLEYRRGGARLKVNMTNRTVHLNGRDPQLTFHEGEMFLYIASHPGKILSKEVLLEHLYSLRPGEAPEIKIIDVWICKVRSKLETVAGADGAGLIETVWGKGYRLSADSDTAAAA